MGAGHSPAGHKGIDLKFVSPVQIRSDTILWFSGVELKLQRLFPVRADQASLAFHVVVNGNLSAVKCLCGRDKAQIEQKNCTT